MLHDANSAHQAMAKSHQALLFGGRHTSLIPLIDTGGEPIGIIISAQLRP